MTSDPELLSFEAALAELQAIVGELETGDGALADNLARYQRGMALVERCQKLLDAAELSVRQLLPDGTEVDFSGPSDRRS